MAIAIAAPVTTTRAISRVPVASRICPANHGPAREPLTPMERTIPVAVAADSSGMSSTGSASNKGSVPWVIPRMAITNQPKGRGIYMAIKDNKAATTADTQRNGFVKPILCAAHGIRNIKGIDIHCIHEIINAANSGVAPFSIMSFGVHPTQV